MIEKLYFKNLIQLDDKTDKRFLIHVNKLSAKQLDIEVLSYENDDLEQYTTHAVFTLKPQEVMEKHKLDLSSEDFRMVHMADSKLLLSLDLQEEFLEDLDAYHLHPSMLDGILGAMVFTKKMYSVTELLYDITGDHDVITAHIHVYNDQGDLVEKKNIGSDNNRDEMMKYFLFAKTANKFIKRGGKLIFAADQGLALKKDELQVNPLQYAMLSSGRIVGMENTGFTTQMIQISEFNITELLKVAARSELDGGYGGIGLEYIEQLLDVNAEVHIAWPGWKETGMALNFGDLDAADEHLLMKSVTNMEGREYIKLSLHAGDSGFIAGEFNTSKVEEYLGAYIQLPSGYSDGKTRTNVEGEEEEARPYQIKDYGSLTVTGTDRQDDIEKFVTVVFASVLDLNEIDVHKSFTDLGGDSLKAFGIYGPIAEQFNIDIEVADVFIYPTIVQLSEYVKELMEEAAA
ncbi:hypothetical protein HK101_010224 [Irineochytrium annulatum]|nr:hypothetical protein HK101_010224 [Irineochytrium annulatum]